MSRNSKESVNTVVDFSFGIPTFGSKQSIDAFHGTLQGIGPVAAANCAKVTVISLSCTFCKSDEIEVT